MTKIKEELGSVFSKWYVWLFPFFAVCLCVYLLFQYLISRGPHITISFEEGANIQAEKTEVRYRGVRVGKVSGVKISEDKKEVIAEVDLDRDAESFAVEGSKFWVVTPKVSLEGISGLETIIQGPYIAVMPGRDEDKKQKDFKGSVGAVPEDPLEDTIAYHLETDSVDSIGVGDPVTFRGMKVGAVSKISLSKTGQAIQVQINIQNKYRRLVRTNTFFWRKTALDAKLGLFKSEVKINSLESMLKGGIEFFTPTEAGEIAKRNTNFVLYGAPPKDWQKWNPVLNSGGQ